MCYFSSFFLNTYICNAYTISQTNERKKAIQTKCHWNCFYSLVVSSLSFFLISVLHNRFSLCVCLLCTQFTHTNPAAHIFPLSKSNAWRGKNSHFISGDLFKVMTQSEIIRCFATMCACTCVLDWMKHIKCKKITNKLKKRRMKERKKGKWRSRRQQRTPTSKTTNTIRDFWTNNKKWNMPKIDCVGKKSIIIYHHANFLSIFSTCSMHERLIQPENKPHTHSIHERWRMRQSEKKREKTKKLNNAKQHTIDMPLNLACDYNIFYKYIDHHICVYAYGIKSPGVVLWYSVHSIGKKWQYTLKSCVCLCLWVFI